MFLMKKQYFFSTGYLFFLNFSIFLIFSFMLLPIKSFAFMEITGEAGYDRFKYGASNENNVTTKSYSGTLAKYIFGYTGIEFSYSHSDERTLETTDQDLTEDSYNLTITERTGTIIRQVQGVGIKQAFAGRQARIRPMLSLGYARQTIKSSGNLTIIDHNDSDSQTVLALKKSHLKSNSMYGSFSLQFSLTKTISLNLSVKSVFPAFKFSDAENDLRYLAGFTWFL